MTETIWKFRILDIDDEIVVDMPDGARVLLIDRQDGYLCAWARVNPDNEVKPHTIYTRGTGHSFTGEEGQYLGTLIDYRGLGLVFHFFDQRKNDEAI